MTQFSLIQRQIIESPLSSRLFVIGKAGTGKTTTGVERIRFLLAEGVPADSVLLLTPQRTLQEPYLDLLDSPDRIAGGEVTSATVGGLARRMCDLFWTLAAQGTPFSPGKPPVFLTLETAQYFMAHIVRPLIEEKGYFESVTISRNRLYSQIIDNLNKAAIIGISHTEIGARLDSAWFGDPAQRRIYADAQECANLFRQFCYEHNLLDFSLQLELFNTRLWRDNQVRAYLTQTYQHLIYDNIEEDISCAHDIMREWLPEFESVLLIYDKAAGYRKFLGGDPATALDLSRECHQVIELEESFVSSGNIIQLSDALHNAITHEGVVDTAETEPALDFIIEHFHPEMLDEIVRKIQSLLMEEGTPPGEIVILAPYLSDSLRFSITNRLNAAGIPWRSNRPSRSLRDEPASKCLLTLSALAHPQWYIHPPKFDVAHALMFALNTDLIRSQLLTEIVYSQRDLRLSAFEKIQPDTQERITYSLGSRYTSLRDWLENYHASEPLPYDFFLRKLFGEVLSQPDFGFHSNLDAVRIAASLVESIRKFRNAMEPTINLTGLRGSNEKPEPLHEDLSGFRLGMEYMTMLQDGVIAAQYLEAWRSENTDAVLVAPAYTFMMMNRPAAYQFWLDPGSDGWSQRVSQPLTHPYVLSREWDSTPGRLWLDSDEFAMETENLARLAGGLLARCRKKIFPALSDLGAAGFEQRGALLRAFQKIIQSRGS